MAEAELTSVKTTESAPRGRMSRWWVGGPLLVVVLVFGGMFGWKAWKHHQFEKERTETPPHVVDDLKLKLLWIPAGTFLMWTEEEEEWLKSLKKRYNEVKPAGWSMWKEKRVTDEMPATEVTLTKGFYLGETEVTQAQWVAVMGSNPSHFNGPNCPVEQVSWEECVVFCRKLTERERAAGRIGKKQVFRLLTEAEWEYACRAGSLGKWSFGEVESGLGEFAWYQVNSLGETKEVGKLRSNSWGLRDMHGNVWEWCVDGFEDYPGGKVTDPQGVVSGSGLVFRGGDWLSSADGCRSVERGGNFPDYRFRNLGFRLALSLTP